jgi:hypothetical protein
VDESQRGQIMRLVSSEGWHIGIPDIEREVWNRLPERFRFLYEIMWLRAFGPSIGGRYSNGSDPNVVASTKRVVRVSTNQTETRGGASSGKKLAGASTKDTISSDRALEQLRKVDRRLRTLARDMAMYIGGDEARGSVRRCSRCKRYGDGDWLYCPRDAAPMEEVD